MPTRAWTDERLDDLAAALRPLPEQMAKVAAAVEHLTEESRALRADLTRETKALRTDLSEETRALRADLTGVRTDMSGVRGDLSATQRQMTQIGFMLAASLIGAVVALILALI